MTEDHTRSGDYRCDETADFTDHELERILENSELGFPVADWDRFEIIARLGEGGMGRVFKA
ncbi:MAG: hypothetical protein K8R59_00210, partial [Thermoanaerobaculales bacterium]|nr:hypothetical protein [Thermoanaerobaculales bacterium]